MSQPMTQHPTTQVAQEIPCSSASKDKSQRDRIVNTQKAPLNLDNTIYDYVGQLGDETQRKELKLYT